MLHLTSYFLSDLKSKCNLLLLYYSWGKKKINRGYLYLIDINKVGERVEEKDEKRAKALDLFMAYMNN